MINAALITLITAILFIVLGKLIFWAGSLIFIIAALIGVVAIFGREDVDSTDQSNTDNFTGSSSNTDHS